LVSSAPGRVSAYVPDGTVTEATTVEALASLIAARREQSPAPTVTSQVPSPGSASAPSVVVVTTKSGEPGKSSHPARSEAAIAIAPATTTTRR
jgi:hypothetical protein